MSTIDLTADYVNVSDLTERAEELRDEREALESDLQDAEYAVTEDSDIETSDARLAARGALADWVIENEEELASLSAILNELEGNGGDHQWDGSWYPAQLIHERAFESAMDELLEDCGDIPRDLPSYLSITVDYVALQQDYKSIEIDGESYLYR